MKNNVNFLQDGIITYASVSPARAYLMPCG
jgi:hypothetical protein